MEMINVKKKYKEKLQKFWNGLKKFGEVLLIGIGKAFNLLFRRDSPYGARAYQPVNQPISLERSAQYVLLDEEENKELKQYIEDTHRQKQEYCNKFPAVPYCRDYSNSSMGY